MSIPASAFTFDGSIPVAVAGGGFSGLTKELDATVQAAAEALASAYALDVTIRFNSDRRRGGAWLRTHETDGIHDNAELGIGAGLDPETGELYVDVFVRASHLKVAAMANRGNPGREYLLREFPSVEAALAFCLEQAAGFELNDRSLPTEEQSGR
jgi:hypothetical protein